MDRLWGWFVGSSSGDSGLYIEFRVFFIGFCGIENGFWIVLQDFAGAIGFLEFCSDFRVSKRPIGWGGFFGSADHS